MKKYIFIISLSVGYFVYAFAQSADQNLPMQKIAVIDIQKIINQISEFKNMQDELSTLSDNWSIELDSLRSDVEIAKNNLNAERFLLTPDLIKKREEDLHAKEMQISNLQKKYFASNGIFNTKRKNTMDQIIHRISDVIADVAKRENISLVLDKMNGESVIYFEPAIDITQKVLNALKGSY